jgi:hypothetical protein
MPFVNTIEAASSGGSDWDTNAVSEAYDPDLDTSNAGTAGSGDPRSNLVPISGYTGTYPYTCGWTVQHRTRYASNALTSPSGTRNGGLQTAYHGISGKTHAPYMATWNPYPSKPGQYNTLMAAGWRVAKKEATTGTFHGNYATYNDMQYSPDGAGEGFGTLEGAVSIALSDYDGNAANWRDYDGYGAVQQQVRYTFDASSNVTVTNAITPVRNVLAINGWAPDVNSGKPRIFMGSEAANFTDTDAGTPVAGGGGNDHYGYTGGTSTQNNLAAEKYFARFIIFAVKTTEQASPGYPIGGFAAKYSGAQPTYMNSATPTNFDAASTVRDFYIYGPFDYSI